MTKPGAIRIGISGWRYKGWRGAFYPEDLPQKRELEFASRAFPTIEINGTFYNLQTPDYFSRWADTVPDGFVFAVKSPRYISHIRRLKEVEAPLANFIASGVLCLGPKLGPFLWQFPPSFKFDPERIEAFFKLLPNDTDEAAAFARRHKNRFPGKVASRRGDTRPLRHAMEIRNESFRDPAFIHLLRRYEVALVCADTVEWPRLMDLTSDFVYSRLHGSEVLYTSGYDEKALNQWTKRVVAWANGGEPPDAERVIDKPGPKRAARDVYVYFDNDAKVKAPADAKTLTAKVERTLTRRDKRAA
ncbi:MAG TPA: DUF72 domain-containing protein [Alphaproteobacteria bacterium]|nr:DUF72 domain-containing protein [Alphaproteobacteria bacterium]